MKYYELDLCLAAPQGDEGAQEMACDILSATLADAGYESFEYTEKGLKAYIQTGLYDEATLRQTIDAFPLPGWQITWECREAEYTNWNETWEKEGFQPILIDTRLCIHSPNQHTLPDSSEVLPHTTYELQVSPRLAFGSGTHPTTRQLLEVLLETPTLGMHVIDAGCGTGILGLLCLLRGAAKVSAYDIDEWSVENTRENVQLNHLQHLDVRQGNASVLPEVTHQQGHANLLIANINRNILLQDLPAFAQAIDPQGGRILISGFYEEDIPSLLEKAAELGLHESLRRVRGGWAVLMLSGLR